MPKVAQLLKHRLAITVFVVAAVVALFVLPPQFLNQYYMVILTTAGFYVIASLGYNFVIGLSGQFAVCQAAFWAIGAYVSAILSTRLGWPFWGTLAISVVSVTAFTSLLGMIVVRWKGHYLAMVTLGLGVITTQVLNGWLSLTQGPIGIRNIRPPGALHFFNFFTLDFSTARGYYFLVLFFAILTVIAVLRIKNSRIGDAFIAIRDNEVAAEVAGINTYRYKLLAFAMSAFFAALSGTLYAHYWTIIVPTMADMTETLKMLLIIVVGGSGVFGVAFSAVLITFMPEWLRVLDSYRMLLYGGALILILLFLPGGLPEGARRLGLWVWRLFKRTRPEAESARNT